jgi:hypothetical protein
MDEIEESNERARRGEHIVPTCHADITGEPCGSQHWVQREEAVAKRYRVLWAASEEGYPSPRGWRQLGEGEAAVVEGRWDPIKPRDEAIVCENGHEPDEAALERLTRFFAEVEPFEEDEWQGPHITGWDMGAFDAQEGGSR